MEPTPFERLKIHREKMAFQSAAIKALLDLIEREKECQAQVDYWKSLTGAEQAEETPIMAEVLKDQIALNQAIALICENLNLES
jgi:hypothetical protein